MNRRTIAADALVAVALAASITVVIGTIESVSHVANISNPYIIGIAILASRRGLYPALVASALAFVAFDWFFILHCTSLRSATRANSWRWSRCW